MADETSWMNPTECQVRLASDRRRAEWTERIERYARDAAPRTRPFAEALVAFLPPPVGAHVLDVATGTGLVAVEAARLVGPCGSVLATDFLPAWERFVRTTASTTRVANVMFASMPAEALALPDASFDLVYCQFGLMFVPEPIHALREMRRVLRPGGRIGIAVWSVPEKVGLFLIPRIVAPALPPATPDAPPSPMSMGAPGLIEDMVAEAGFRNVVRHSVTIFAEIADPEIEWQSWRENFVMPDGGGLERLPAHVQQQLRDDVIAAFMSFEDGDTIRVPSEAILVTASR
ncbi:MAG: UbiE/COQ5 methyltransferase [Thermomicrobiales bacterium]|jgi:ubiquinone/menaquinone biosynthesis C-methylase UbiE|nr:UbiE/COQ5 methyltransferase [Thermomicrobiales bacterium]